MTEPELVGTGVPSASRRRFMWLGGGVVASLLLLPEFSFAAKASAAVKKATGGASKAATKPGTRAAASTRAASKSSSAKSSSKAAKSSSASASKSGAKKATSVARSKPGASTRGRSVASRRGNPRGRVVTATRSEVIENDAEIALPSDFASSRPFSFGADAPESRDLSLYCVHTGERLNIDYYVGGRYETGALEAIDHLLRDYHNDETCQFDPRVLNQLFDLRRALGSSEPFHVFSGYRSPETNENYRRISERVAEHSYHLTGQAIDVQLPGRDIRQLRNVAVAMRAGGVGFYPGSGFLHLDSGPVRRW